jgi:amino acid adenylation domain-containing protein
MRIGQLAARDERPAIVEPGRGAISYRDLDGLADAVAHRLRAQGVPPGARIGIYLRRSADAIAAMLGVLRAGCAYVPVDPRAPVERIAEMQIDCGVRSCFIEERFAAAYASAIERLGGRPVALQTLASIGLGSGLRDWIERPIASAPIADDDLDASRLADLACLLYTSGTTGQPKGWMMHRSAIEAHARWCHAQFAPGRDDVFANHAQFNFGMSLFDIYSSLGCGAALVIVPDEIRQHAGLVADLWSSERISIWFSGPAILAPIGQLDDLSTRDLSALRLVAFAGEIFPLPHLNALRERLPHPRFFNFYGSTEANVAAFHELPRGGVLDERPPIGRPCAHYEERIVTAAGERAARGVTGELQLRGAGLAAGYWKRPPADDHGWFRTGDLAVELPDGNLRFAGRIGRMIKLRGYRVEPGEIESRLYQHPSIREAGVVPREAANGLELIAHLSTTTGERLPVINLREFCAVKLPAYMIPARFEFHESLPKTSSGKIDLQRLRAAGAGSR